MQHSESDASSSMSQSSHQQSFDEDWEEWNGKDPFWIHCVAGSLAGVAEHSLVYPLDTVRTHIQVCAECLHYNKNNTNASNSNNGIRRPSLPTGVWQTIRHLVNEPQWVPAAAGSTTTATTAAAATAATPEVLGMSRLWRGVQTILVGCIPAHALYFGLYEAVKASSLDDQGHVTSVGASLAGAAATAGHDMILTPLDTLKQRLQLGHYHGLADALRQVVRTEGAAALFASYPITLATNLPYGIIMVGTNEYCKQYVFDDERSWRAIVLSSSFGGFCAAALTCPLDRVKTALQTQRLAPVCPRTMNSCEKQTANTNAFSAPRYASWRSALGGIYAREGVAGLFRGLTPRILQHVPATAISWTTYETAKRYLQAAAAEQ